MIMLDYHCLARWCSHVGGPQFLMTKLQARFWPIAGYSMAKKIIKGCAKCNIAKPVPLNQQMATMPEFRMQPNKEDCITPYKDTGLDYSGPFYTKQGRGKPRNKRWLALFTCMRTRLTHLEVVHDLTTDTFI